MQHVKLVHRSGAIIEFDAESAEFYVVPPTDDEGNPNSDSGKLNGYRIDTGEKIPIFYARVSEIDIVMVENKVERRRKVSALPHNPSNKSL